jgi:hypothetical protein
MASFPASFPVDQTKTTKSRIKTTKSLLSDPLLDAISKLFACCVEHAKSSSLGISDLVGIISKDTAVVLGQGKRADKDPFFSLRAGLVKADPAMQNTIFGALPMAVLEVQAEELLSIAHDSTKSDLCVRLAPLMPQLPYNVKQFLLKAVAGDSE